MISIDYNTSHLLIFYMSAIKHVDYRFGKTVGSNAMDKKEKTQIVKF